MKKPKDFSALYFYTLLFFLCVAYPYFLDHLGFSSFVCHRFPRKTVKEFIICHNSIFSSSNNSSSNNNNEFKTNKAFFRNNDFTNSNNKFRNDNNYNGLFFRSNDNSRNGKTLLLNTTTKSNANKALPSDNAVQLPNGKTLLAEAKPCPFCPPQPPRPQPHTVVVRPHQRTHLPLPRGHLRAHVSSSCTDRTRLC